MMKRLALLALASGLSISMAAPALAQPATSDTPAIAVSPPRLELGINPGSTIVEAKLTVANLGSRRQLVAAALNDLFVTRSGAYEAVAPEQTPYSVAQVGSLDQDMVELAPAGSADASRELGLSIQLPADGKPRYGAIVVKPVLPEQPAPSQPAGTGTRFGVRITTAVLVPVILVPLGAADRPDLLAPSVRLGIEPAAIELRQARANGWLDRIIPLTLPGVADHGPVAVSVRTWNTGDAFSRAFSRVEFASVHLLSWLPASWRDRLGIADTLFLTADAAPGAAMPGGIAETDVDTEITHQSRSFDTAPIVGLVRVRAETKMVLVDASTEPVVQETWIVVFPWKELTALLLLVVLAGWGRTRWRRTAGTRAAPAPPEPALAERRHEETIEPGPLGVPESGEALPGGRHEREV